MPRILFIVASVVTGRVMSGTHARPAAELVPSATYQGSDIHLKQNLIECHLGSESFVRTALNLKVIMT